MKYIKLKDYPMKLLYFFTVIISLAHSEICLSAAAFATAPVESEQGKLCLTPVSIVDPRVLNIEAGHAADKSTGFFEADPITKEELAAGHKVCEIKSCVEEKRKKTILDGLPLLLTEGKNSIGTISFGYELGEPLAGYFEIVRYITSEYRGKGYGTTATELLHEWVDANKDKSFLSVDLEGAETIEQIIKALENDDNIKDVTFKGIVGTVAELNIASLKSHQNAGSSFYKNKDAGGVLCAYPPFESIPDGYRKLEESEIMTLIEEGISYSKSVKPTGSAEPSDALASAADS